MDDLDYDIRGSAFVAILFLIVGVLFLLFVSIPLGTSWTSPFTPAVVPAWMALFFWSARRKNVRLAKGREALKPPGPGTSARTAKHGILLIVTVIGGVLWMRFVVMSHLPFALAYLAFLPMMVAFHMLMFHWLARPKDEPPANGGEAPHLVSLDLNQPAQG